MQEIALFVVPVLITVFVFSLVKGFMDQRAKAQSDRVQLLEEALKNPAIDRGTIETLAYQLTGAHKRAHQRGGRLLALVLALGWLALFTGSGIWVLGEVVGERDAVAGGIITSIVGFGLVTYPFALRELESRRVQS